MIGTIAEEPADKNIWALYFAPAATTFCSGNVVRETTSNFKSAAPTEAAKWSKALISKLIKSFCNWLKEANPPTIGVLYPKFNSLKGKWLKASLSLYIGIWFAFLARSTIEVSSVASLTISVYLFNLFCNESPLPSLTINLETASTSL